VALASATCMHPTLKRTHRRAHTCSLPRTKPPAHGVQSAQQGCSSLHSNGSSNITPLASAQGAGSSSSSPTESIDLVAPSEKAMGRLAALLVHEGGLQAGDVYCLYGDVGAGKSVFSRAFIRAAAGDLTLNVPSPTYLLQVCVCV
jgi:hypothetical protein